MSDITPDNVPFKNQYHFLRSEQNLTFKQYRSICKAVTRVHYFPAQSRWPRILTFSSIVALFALAVFQCDNLFHVLNTNFIIAAWKTDCDDSDIFYFRNDGALAVTIWLLTAGSLFAKLCIFRCVRRVQRQAYHKDVVNQHHNIIIDEQGLTITTSKQVSSFVPWHATADFLIIEGVYVLCIANSHAWICLPSATEETAEELDTAIEFIKKQRALNK
ncbi:hypothetical protein [Enterobacter sp. ECC-019]|uniref:hypothetical protein n=1 Tax=Enterobacter sp. ECC-019 TaxID=3116478 RepID=UPI0037550D0B